MMTQQVLIVDGPHAGQFQPHDGRERFVLINSKPFDPLNPPAYDEVIFEQVEYVVRPLVMFSQTLLVASRGLLSESDLIDLLLSDLAKQALGPGTPNESVPGTTRIQLAGGPHDGDRHNFDGCPRFVEVMPRLTIQAQQIASGDMLLPKPARYEHTGVVLVDGTEVYRYAPETDPLR
jgi:hypothetical protein